MIVASAATFAKSLTDICFCVSFEPSFFEISFSSLPDVEAPGVEDASENSLVSTGRSEAPKLCWNFVSSLLDVEAPDVVYTCENCTSDSEFSETRDVARSVKPCSGRLTSL